MVQLALPLAIPWFSAICVAMLDGRRRWVSWITAGALVATIAALANLGVDVNRDGRQVMRAGDWGAGVGISLRVDMLGITFGILSLGVLLSAVLFELFSGVRSRSFPGLVLFLATGLTGIFMTGDAFNFYVFFEIAMIASYVLASYGEGARQLRTATIFAVVNLLGSGFFLIGIASMYHLTGSLDMSGIAVRLRVFEPEAVILSAVLIFVAFSTKLGLFPFHFWLPAVYTGTRPAVAAILSGAVANIGSYGLLRFGGEVMPEALELGEIVLVVLGIASIVYGSLQAISRRSINEVLAYSSIGQVGFVLLALAIGGEVGFAAAVLFAIVNSMNKALLFLAGTLRGLLVGFAFAVGAFSVVGIPPAGGYVGKAGMFDAAIAESRWEVVAFVLVGSVFSLVYMFQAFQRRFWAEDKESSIHRSPSPVAVRGVVVVLALLALGVGFWPEPVLWVSQQAALAIPGLGQ